LEKKLHDYKKTASFKRQLHFLKNFKSASTAVWKERKNQYRETTACRVSKCAWRGSKYFYPNVPQNRQFGWEKGEKKTEPDLMRGVEKSPSGGVWCGKEVMRLPVAADKSDSCRTLKRD